MTTETTTSPDVLKAAEAGLSNPAPLSIPDRLSEIEAALAKICSALEGSSAAHETLTGRVDDVEKAVSTIATDVGGPVVGQAVTTAESAAVGLSEFVYKALKHAQII